MKKSFAFKLITIIVAIFAALVSVSYIVYRAVSNQKNEDIYGDEIGI